MTFARLAALIIVFAGLRVSAQTSPPIRQLGRIEHISTDPLASVAAALPMADGHVLINDLTSRRVLLADSTLGHARVVADTPSATPDDISERIDSAFVVQVDPASPVVRDYASLPDRYSQSAAYARYCRAREGSVDLLITVAPAINKLLTPAQHRKLPALTAAHLDHRYLLAVRSGTPGLSAPVFPPPAGDPGGARRRAERRWGKMRTLMLSAKATIVACIFAFAGAGAQKPPAVRQLGRLERVSAESLASVNSALAMSEGRVLVNDVRSRRVLLFDSTLAHGIVVADTTSATANAYGRGVGNLIRYRADTGLFIDVSSLSMLVIGPSGAIARVIAFPPVPPQGGEQALLGARWGGPGFDGRGRLAYFGGMGKLPGLMMIGRGSVLSMRPSSAGQPNTSGTTATGELVREFTDQTDSVPILRGDLTTRVLDTIASIRIPRLHRVLKTDPTGLVTSIETTPDPLPLVDGWAMLPDGSMAIVRARDYHVDWLDPGGHWSSSPKMPFDWQHVSDERKLALIDSAVAERQSSFDQVMRGGRGGGVGGASRGSSGAGRGGGGSRGVGGDGPGDLVPMLAARPPLGDVPDYMPPFIQGSVYADADGNLWICTTSIVGDRPVYDIVNRRGELFDRVQLPSFRTIAGFGPGVIYMAVKDAAGAVHLERARIR